MVDVAVTITALPDDGGATITDVEYRVNGGAAQSSGGTGSFNILGLASVNDTIELRAVNAVGAGPWSNTKNAGAVAVTINSVTVGAYSNGAIPITVDTVETPDGTSALSFVLVPTGQNAPSAAQIQAGQNGLGGTPLDSGTVNWTGTPSITLATGIDEFCDIYVVIDNGALSNVGSDTNFEIDTTTPTLSAVTGTQTGASTADWGATSDEAQGTIFAAVRLATDAVLTKAEIENGTGNAVATNTDATPTADANNGGSFAGLSGSTNYISDAFQRDEFGNESAVVSSAQFTTAAGYSQSVVDNQGAAWLQDTAGSLGSNIRRIEVSCWIKPHALAAFSRVLDFDGLLIARESNGVLGIESYSSGGFQSSVTTTITLTDEVKVHLYVWYDVTGASPVIEVRIDGVDQSAVLNDSDSQFDLRNAQVNICANGSGGEKADVDISDLWVQVNTAQVGHSSFISGGNPLDPSSVGSPSILISGPASQWNNGTNANEAGTTPTLQLGDANQFVDV